MAKSEAPPGDAAGYQAIFQDDQEIYDEEDRLGKPYHRSRPQAHRRHRTTTLVLVICLVMLIALNVYLSLPYLFGRPAAAAPAPGECRPTSTVPQYFQTSPELWAGPTATGSPAFLAQTMSFEPTATFVPNEPLVTNVPVEGMKQGNDSIFRLMGHLSPYQPSPGWGVDEYPLPEGAEIVQLHMLSRHGARYPTSGDAVARLGDKIANASASMDPRGALGFLKHWRYRLGREVLVPKGRQELFNSGVYHAYMYGGLYHASRGKIIVRTTTQDRMLKSAENWMAGFFGLEWTQNATIEVMIEAPGFNNSMSGWLNCPNAQSKTRGDEARDAWMGVYLADAVARFNAMTGGGFEWTLHDVYAAQSMCAYETVGLGSSAFCPLFTYDEWVGFGYSIDLAFSGGSAFHSPVGRAVGIGYQQEVLARLRNHTLGPGYGSSPSQANTTLDGSEETFPLHQSLYLDFSHDTNMASVLTAFGLVQLAEELPSHRHPGAHWFTVAHMTPFGAHMDLEVIRAPKPVSANRTGYLRGAETRYVHLSLNQRTVPLGRSLAECGERVDGWCELETFLRVQDGMAARARYDFSCFGEYDAVQYGGVTDGVPN